ncbi:MAG: MGMT family protein [Coriobacteriales bacterium]|jgi:methylated-DNA-protein-cysteine methyltransferase-like protein|nr:MGMT family protein [Coriobacteriales bacterium]
MKARTAQTDNTFFKRVYALVAQVPRGRVVSYGQIAALLGNPRAARSVGWALSACPEELPWQRVVKADGSVTGGVWAELRRELLGEEGVDFLPDGRVDMDACRWDFSA